MWRALKRHRFSLLGAAAIISVAIYGWSYNQWRQKIVYANQNEVTADAAGILWFNGEQIYPDPDRWFYLPAIGIFRGYQSASSFVNSNGVFDPHYPYTISIAIAEDQSEPGVITIHNF